MKLSEQKWGCDASGIEVVDDATDEVVASVFSGLPDDADDDEAERRQACFGNAIAALPDAARVLLKWMERDRGDPTLALKEETAKVLRAMGELP